MGMMLPFPAVVISQMRHLRHGKVQWFSQGHKAVKLELRTRTVALSDYQVPPLDTSLLCMVIMCPKRMETAWTSEPSGCGFEHLLMCFLAV